MRTRNSGLAGELQARQLISDLGLTALPINPFDIAAQKKIFCEGSSRQGAGISGCLLRVGNEFAIYYNTKIASVGFQRFTVAHELGHFFIPGHAESLFPGGNGFHQSNPGYRSDDKLEREADEFAANLLMPENLFKAEYGRLGEGLATVEALAALCVTSLTATAIRYAKLTDGLAAIIVSEGNRIQFSKMSPMLQGLNGISSSQIQKNAGLPHGSATIKFNRDASNILERRKLSAPTTPDMWFGEGGSMNWTEEVIGLGDYGKTLTVIWAEQDQIQETEEEQSEEDAEEYLMPSQRRRDRF